MGGGVGPVRAMRERERERSLQHHDSKRQLAMKVEAHLPFTTSLLPF